MQYRHGKALAVTKVLGAILVSLVSPGSKGSFSVEVLGGSFVKLICSQIPLFPPFHTLSVKSLGSQTCLVKTPLTLLFYPHSILSLHGPLVTYAKLRQKSCLLVVSSDNDADSSIRQLPESTSMLENNHVPLAYQ